MRKEVLSMADVVKRTGIKKHQIVYALESGKIPEPSTLNGRRCFSSRDLERIHKYFQRRNQMHDDTFATMRDLARVIGGAATSHTVGKDLTRLGLRANGKPTSKAHELGLIRSASTGKGDGSGFFWVWHREKTLSLLTNNESPAS